VVARRYRHPGMADLTRRRLPGISAGPHPGERLRGEQQACRSLTLTVRYTGHSTTTLSRTLPEPTAHSPQLRAATHSLHRALGLQRARVRSLALRGRTRRRRIRVPAAGLRPRRRQGPPHRSRGRPGTGPLRRGTARELAPAQSISAHPTPPPCSVVRSAALAGEPGPPACLTGPVESRGSQAGGSPQVLACRASAG
jgi:hypothetical protein